MLNNKSKIYTTRE